VTLSQRPGQLAVATEGKAGSSALAKSAHLLRREHYVRAGQGLVQVRNALGKGRPAQVWCTAPSGYDAAEERPKNTGGVRLLRVHGACGRRRVSFRGLRPCRDHCTWRVPRHLGKRGHPQNFEPACGPFPAVFRTIGLPQTGHGGASRSAWLGAV
jgi:hypothetical protein